MQRRFLARHKIAISDERILGEMAYFSSIATHGKRYLYDNVVKRNKNRERGCERFRLIEKLLASFSTERELYDESEAVKLPGGPHAH